MFAQSATHFSQINSPRWQITLSSRFTTVDTAADTRAPPTAACRQHNRTPGHLRPFPGLGHATAPATHNHQAPALTFGTDFRSKEIQHLHTGLSGGLPTYCVFSKS